VRSRVSCWGGGNLAVQDQREPKELTLQNRSEGLTKIKVAARGKREEGDWAGGGKEEKTRKKENIQQVTFGQRGGEGGRWAVKKKYHGGMRDSGVHSDAWDRD